MQKVRQLLDKVKPSTPPLDPEAQAEQEAEQAQLRQRYELSSEIAALLGSFVGFVLARLILSPPDPEANEQKDYGQRDLGMLLSCIGFYLAARYMIYSLHKTRIDRPKLIKVAGPETIHLLSFSQFFVYGTAISDASSVDRTELAHDCIVYPMAMLGYGLARVGVSRLGQIDLKNRATLDFILAEITRGVTTFGGYALGQVFASVNHTDPRTTPYKISTLLLANIANQLGGLFHYGITTKDPKVIAQCVYVIQVLLALAGGTFVGYAVGNQLAKHMQVEQGNEAYDAIIQTSIVAGSALGRLKFFLLGQLFKKCGSNCINKVKHGSKRFLPFKKPEEEALISNAAENQPPDYQTLPAETLTVGQRPEIT